MKLKAIIHDADEGGFWAEVPALPGCVTEGETIDEITINLKEAIIGWLSAEDSHAEKLDATRVIELTV